MKVIEARNVHEALPLGIRLLKRKGIRRESRVGPCWEYPTPVTTVLHRPEERVLFHPERDANPFLHFFEGLWVLAGRNDVAFLAQFTERFLSYSDDGVTLHGAYGYRFRRAFGLDQLALAVRMLQDNAADRRVVLQIWDTGMDLGRVSKDIPCNDLVLLKIRDDRLLATVVTRSHDIIWGAYGTNAVTFSMLQEYLALRIGVDLGPLTMVSDSYHAYEGVWEACQHITDTSSPYTPPVGSWLTEATSLGVERDPLWDVHLLNFLKDPEAPPVRGASSHFLARVAQPFYQAFRAYKAGDRIAAMTALTCMDSTDWSLAAAQWLDRRKSMQKAPRG